LGERSLLAIPHQLGLLQGRRPIEVVLLLGRYLNADAVEGGALLACPSGRLKPHARNERQGGKGQRPETERDKRER